MSKNDEIDGEIMPLPGRNATETEIKHSAALILHEAGMSNEAIARTIQRHPVTICNTLKKMKRESFSHPRRVKAAAKTLDNILDGFNGKKVETIDNDGKKTVQIVTDERVKASDAMRAVEIIGKAAGEIGGDQAATGPAQVFYAVNMQVFSGAKP